MAVIYNLDIIKAIRFKVRCTICHEVFQNDYVRKHTKCKHKDLHVTGRLAPVTIEVDQSDVRVKWMPFLLNS